MIEIYPLKQIPDERGKIMHMLRNDADHFDEFGEIYFSVIYPGAIKAWHLHTKMTLNYACIVGNIKLVLYDGKQFQEMFIGESNYSLVKIPPGIWNGFKGLGLYSSIVANCSTLPHDPNEIIRKPYNAFDYDWSIKHG